ncbi:hypothetical protein FRC03_006347 [Tulasnella sp. 419]|nr:hypothetical protein FRC03_006347 [Tulasnella sp. 419]
MPSVRVRRTRGRPYTVIQDSPTLVPASLPQSANASISSPVSPVGGGGNVRRGSVAAGSQRADRSPARPRSRTLASIFVGGGHDEQGPTAPRSPQSETASHTYPARRGSILPPIYIDDEDRPTSWVSQHCLKNRRTIQGDLRLLSPQERAASPPHERAPSPLNRRESIVSSHSGGIPNVRMTQEDLHGRVGSALSMRSSQMIRDGIFEDDEHHHDEIVEHLDVIDPEVATVTHLSNATNSIFLPPLPNFNRRPIVNLPTIPDEGDREKGPYKDELDMHVEHVLTRRDKFRRGLRGLWAFVKTPIGFCTALYGFLVAFWGGAIVVFLAKIINFHNEDLQGFWVEVSSQVTNGLFTATGVGLIPWRVIDTYRILKIWRFKHLSHKLRKQRGLPPLVDEDDLPDPMVDPHYVHVLTDEQQLELHYQQQMFLESQTWYRPHATETHRAFPINTALLICLLIDGNSIFQVILCGVMWGLNRFTRPAWTTGSLIPLSFLCAILASVFIFRGSAKTKKTKQVEEKLREALQLEKEGLMNAHIRTEDGFEVVECNKDVPPPPNATTLVIPTTSRTDDKGVRDGNSGVDEKRGSATEVDETMLCAVPSGPSSKTPGSSEPTKLKKAPVMP